VAEVEGVGVVISLVAGLVLVVLMLWVFVRRDGWADAEESADCVEHVHLRRMAEAGISSLSPGAIRLAEKERVGDGISPAGTAPAREFWRRFAAASASVEGDPAAAIEELRGLPGLLEEALRGVGREAAAAEGTHRREEGR
jgi:hypothetical protein